MADNDRREKRHAAAINVLNDRIRELNDAADAGAGLLLAAVVAAGGLVNVTPETLKEVEQYELKLVRPSDSDLELRAEKRVRTSEEARIEPVIEAGDVVLPATDDIDGVQLLEDPDGAPYPEQVQAAWRAYQLADEEDPGALHPLEYDALNTAVKNATVPTDG